VARDRDRKKGFEVDPGDDGLSIIGPGMLIKGDLKTRGSVRIEGTVEGTVNAGKAVVVGREGTVKGDIVTQDAVLAGTIQGTIRAKSRLEIESTCRVDGEIYAKTLKLDEGAILNGQVRMGEAALEHDGLSAPASIGLREEAVQQELAASPSPVSRAT